MRLCLTPTYELLYVIPAKARISQAFVVSHEIPAFAGMTEIGLVYLTGILRVKTSVSPAESFLLKR